MESTVVDVCYDEKERLWDGNIRLEVGKNRFLRLGDYNPVYVSC